MFKFISPAFLLPVTGLKNSLLSRFADNQWRQWHPLQFALLATLLLTVQLNGPFFSALNQHIPGQTGLQLSLFWLLFCINLLLMLLFGLRSLQKPAFILLFFTGACSHYFMQSFGIVIDKTMLQNALETDPAEAAGLISTGLGWALAGMMLLPLSLSRLIWLKPVPLRLFIKQWLLLMLLLWLSVLAVAATSYAELAPFFRNFRQVKHLALPISPISAAVAMSGQLLKTQFPPRFTPLGLDATQKTSNPAKARLLVLVLGETARADHFQLNGYQRPTNPQLSQLPVYSFHDVSACGTATAHSVPCMFSNMGRELYKETVAKNSSNVLDVLKFAGVHVSWLDNNSGCKGVCDRLEHQFLFQQQKTECRDGQCLDEILLDALKLELTEHHTSKDHLIVLHQLGSHGPEYYKRSSEKQKKFQPECRDKQLQLCPQSDVVNAYDNSILATDALLASVILLLQQQDKQTAMLYLSDHGESLGENGVYLHGLPYWMAPKAQTQVPMIWWMSQALAQNAALDSTCLQQHNDHSYSHDNLFHSLLGIFTVSTALYQPELDLFRPCTGG